MVPHRLPADLAPELGYYQCHALNRSAQRAGDREFDGRRALGRRLSLDRSWDVHAIRSDVEVICVKLGYQS
jgi:hypothetical protein